MLNVKVIVGSTRPGRFSEKVLPWLTENLSQHKDMQIEVLDLRDYNLPLFDLAFSPSFMQGSDYGNEAINTWSQKIKEADAYIVITPEYNHAPSAVVKNAFDLVSKEWNNKPISFIAYGSVGGARAVEQLRMVAIELHMASVRTSVHIPMHWLMLDEAGNVKPGSLDASTQQLSDMLGQLQWWGDALKSAREKA
jgi:NAD(P)H-dependent FMN reductase